MSVTKSSLMLLLLVASNFAFSATPETCNWSAPGLTRDEAWKSFQTSCTTPQAKSACLSNFLRSEDAICKATRRGAQPRSTATCDFSDFGMTREQAKQSFLTGCESAPTPAKRQECRSAWDTRETEICQRLREMRAGVQPAR